MSDIVIKENNMNDTMEMAKRLAESTLVPAQFKKIENCIIAVEVAKKLNTDAFSVMQNMYVVHNKVSWSSQYIIGLINNSGKFSGLNWKITGEGDNKTCIAYARRLSDGEIVESPPVSIEMAKKEGWFSKTGSKWLTMPDLMLRYRAGTLFGRLYIPEILNGMYSVDEIEDMTPINTIEKKNSNEKADFLNQMFLEGELVD